MKRDFLDDLRRAASWLVRERSFAGPATISLALGAGLALSILGLLRLDSLSPLRLSSTIAPHYIRDPGWGAKWSGLTLPPERIQAVHFESLLDVLAVVAILGFAIASFTVVILVLIRTSSRTGEVALRTAVGASRRRLLRHSLAEGVLVAALGGLAGLLIGYIGVGVARAGWPHSVHASGPAIDPWLLMLGLSAPLLLTVLCMLLADAGVLRRADLSGALTAGADATGTQSELILQDFLAIVQLAVSIALVTCAGLLIQNTLPALESSSPGIEQGQFATAELDLPKADYPDEAGRAAYYEALLDAFASPAEARAGTLSTPGAWLGVGSLAQVTADCGQCSFGGFYMPMMPGSVRLHAVSPGFFESLGVRLLEGREFIAADRTDAQRVMVVNRTFAESHFENGEPLGRKVQIGGIQDPWYTVVGVVDAIEGKGLGPARRAGRVAYVSILQDPPLSADLAVHVSGDPQHPMPLLTEAVVGGGSTVVVSGVSTMESALAFQAAPIHWLALLFGAVGGLALIVAVHGAYSVMLLKVRRRRKEIGIRRALGARRWRIVQVIVLQSSGLIAVGAALGVLGALLLAGWLDAMVPGLRAFDLRIYGGSVLLLAAAALVGGSASARAATRIPPIAAVRAE
jgi:predicted permease